MFAERLQAKRLSQRRRAMCRAPVCRNRHHRPHPSRLVMLLFQSCQFANASGANFAHKGLKRSIIFFDDGSDLDRRPSRCCLRTPQWSSLRPPAQGLSLIFYLPMEMGRNLIIGSEGASWWKIDCSCPSRPSLQRQWTFRCGWRPVLTEVSTRAGSRSDMRRTCK